MPYSKITAIVAQQDGVPKSELLMFSAFAGTVKASAMEDEIVLGISILSDQSLLSLLDLYRPGSIPRTQSPLEARSNLRLNRP